MFQSGQPPPSVANTNERYSSATIFCLFIWIVLAIQLKEKARHKYVDQVVIEATLISTAETIGVPPD